MNEPIRLAKRLAALLGCSRREAEQYIEGGWVRVDGALVEAPQFKVLDQKIELDPEASLATIEPVSILLHKPAGQDAAAALQSIGATSQGAGDVSGIRILKRHFSGLTPTASLDDRASGMLVFTQDARIVRKFLEDAAKIEHEYVVEVTGDLVADGLKLLNQGLRLNGKALTPAKVSWQNETRLRFALKDMQPGQIQQMCERVGLQVVAMKRIRIGRVPMARLPPGEWRYLMPSERF